LPVMRIGEAGPEASPRKLLPAASAILKSGELFQTFFQSPDRFLQLLHGRGVTDPEPGGLTERIAGDRCHTVVLQKIDAEVGGGFYQLAIGGSFPEIAGTVGKDVECTGRHETAKAGNFSQCTDDVVSPLS